jgi:integrase
MLEKAEPIQRFKASYRHGRAVATVNRALSALRGAINWVRFQDPPLLMTSPFHRFGVTIRTKDETKRDRRVGPDEEKALLDAALALNSEEHLWAGAAMHDRIIGALETCCRKGEMLLIRNRHVDWERHQLAIPGAHAKDSENRRVPFDPQGRLAPILKRRGKLGPSAFVFGSPRANTRTRSGPPGSLSCFVRTVTTPSERRKALASIERSSGRSTCTGTTCATRAPADSWPRASTSAPFN